MQDRERRAQRYHWGREQESEGLALEQLLLHWLVHVAFLA